MANIVEYNAPTHLAPEPSDRASSSHAMAARRIDIAYNQAGAAYQRLGHEVGSTISELGRQYVEYQEHREISAGGLAFTTSLAGLQNAWNETIRKADPNDPTLQQHFLEGQVEPTLQKLKEGFHTLKGQEWAEHHADRIRSHFLTTTTADISTMAGLAVHNNFVRSANVLAAQVDKDPSFIGPAMDSLKEHVDMLANSSPGMKGTAAEKFRADATQHGMELIVKAGIQSAIRRGISEEELSRDYLQNPKYAPYINVGEIKSFEQQQRQMTRFARSDERYQRQVEKQEQHEKGQEGINQIIQGLHEQPGRWNMQRIIRMKENGELPGPWFEHAARIIERETKEETPARKSEDNERLLAQRIRLPIGDPNRIESMEPILKSWYDGDINKAARNDLLNIMTESRSAEGQKWNDARKKFLDAVKPSIDKSIFGAINHPAGAMKFYEFQQELDRQAAELGPKDRWKLLRSGNSEYMGAPDKIKPYVTPMDARVQEMLKGITQGAPAEKRPPLSGFER